MEQAHAGVSPFGEQVIAELNQRGVMVDVSHLSKASTLDVVRLSDARVISSHSSMHAVAPNPRKGNLLRVWRAALSTAVGR